MCAMYVLPQGLPSNCHPTAARVATLSQVVRAAADKEEDAEAAARVEALLRGAWSERLPAERAAFVAAAARLRDALGLSEDGQARDGDAKVELQDHEAPTATRKDEGGGRTAVAVALD